MIENETLTEDSGSSSRAEYPVVTLEYTSNDDRIAEALERIAAALEKLAG